MTDPIFMIRHLSRITGISCLVYTEEMELKETITFGEKQISMMDFNLDLEKTCTELLGNRDVGVLRIPSQLMVFLVHYDKCFYLFGPIRILSNAQSERTVNEKVTNAKVTNAKVLIQGCYMDNCWISEIEWQSVMELFCIFYGVITEKPITAVELWNKIGEQTEVKYEIRKNVHEVIFEQLEEGQKHQSYDYEKRLMDAVRTGNIGALERIWNTPIGGNYGVLSKDNLRSNKNLGIAMITMLSRAAAEGGVSFEKAMAMSDAFILRIEEMKSWEEIIEYCYHAAEEYALLVKDAIYAGQKNALVEKCENLIFRKLHGKVLVNELAEELHVSPDYLSRIFHDQTGVKIGDFIQNEKIKLAKNMLKYSDYSLESIAYYLGYASQSHFGKVFKKVTSMTPKQFRENRKTTVYT